VARVVLKTGFTAGPGIVQGMSTRKARFDVRAFLDSAGLSKRMVEYGRNEGIVAQGDAPDAHMLSRNIRIEQDLVDQLFNSSEKRLARALLLLARYGKQDKPQHMVSKLSQFPAHRRASRLITLM
jgi:hypothetical protein